LGIRNADARVVLTREPSPPPAWRGFRPTRANGFVQNEALACETAARTEYDSNGFRRPPAETDMQRHFQVSPPSVHQMIVTLERNGYMLNAYYFWIPALAM
jgi:Iron dependent repressor, N-terminal DNA binding domain